MITGSSKPNLCIMLIGDYFQNWFPKGSWIVYITERKNLHTIVNSAHCWTVKQVLPVTHRLHGFEQPFPLGWGQFFSQKRKANTPPLSCIACSPCNSPSLSLSFPESQLTLSPETALGEKLYFHTKCAVK